MAREYYSIPEAAARLGLSRIAVFKKVKKGRLEAIRVGRNWAVPAAALEKAAVPGKTARLPAQKAIPFSPPPPSPDSEMDSMGWD